MKVNINSITSTAMLITVTIIFLSLLPQASAITFTCYDTNYNGELFKCTDRQPFTENYRYLIEDKGTHYKINNSGDSCKLPKNQYWSYDFGINKISPKITIPTLAKLSNVALPHNGSVYYIPITNMSSAVKKCGNLFWDDEFWIKDNGTHYAYDEIGFEIKNYSYFPVEDGTFKVVNNELRFYAEKSWFLSATYPIFLTFDSWIVNSTEDGGWNGTFDNTTLDVNLSVIPNRNLSHSLFQEARSYYTMDGIYRNTTHILDFNQTTAGHGLISGTVDEIGTINRSQRFADPDFILLPEFSYTMGVGFTFIFQAKKDVAGAVDIPIGRSSTPNENYVSLFSDGNLYMEMTTPSDFAVGSYTQDTNWHDYAISCHITSCVIYVDLVDTTSDGTMTGAAINLNQLGRRGTDTAFMNGTEDNFGMWRRNLSLAEITTITNGSDYFTSNFTAPPRGNFRDAGLANGIVNVTYDFTCDGNGTVDAYLNYSTDASTWNTELLGTGITTLVNETPTNQARYYHVTWNSINTGGGICHLHEIVAHEAVVAVAEPPNITSMSPPNNTVFSQEGNFLNIEFGAICTSNVSFCDNGTLSVWNATLDPVTIIDIHFVTEIVEVNGTIVGDTINEDDQNYLTINEISGGNVECLEAIVNFSNVPTAHDHTIVGDHRYDGGAGHQILGWWKNWTSGDWINFFTLSKTVQDVSFETAVIPALDSIDANGNFSIKINHTEGGSACIGSHDYLIDLLKLDGNNDIADFVGGVANITIELTAAQSPYLFSWSAVDVNGTTQAAPIFGNYTIFINATAPQASNIIIIQPENKTYTAINDIPYRGYVLNEVELDTIWYSLNEDTNITFTFNTTLFNLDTNSYILRTCINRTNGRENCTTDFFTVDYDGFGIEPEGLGGTFMETTVFILFNLLAFSIGILSITVIPVGDKRAFTSLLSMVIFFALALWSQDLSHFTGGTSISYEIAGLLWFYAGLGFIMFIYALVNFIFMTVKPTDDPYGADVTDGGYGIFQNEGFLTEKDRRN